MSSHLWLLLIIALFLIESGNSQCPPGSFNGLESSECYTLPPQKLNWLDAENECWQMNGNLISIPDPTANQFIHNMTGYLAEDFWTGGNVVGDGSWMWSDGTLFNYTNWQKGNPRTKPKQQCLAIEPSSGKWVSHLCDDMRPYICKTSAIPTEQPTCPPAPVSTCPACPTSAPPTCCPDDTWTYISRTKKCHYITTSYKLSWTEALDVCKSLGGTLTSIHSDEEYNALLDYTRSTSIVKQNPFYNGALAHIGLFNHGSSLQWTDGTGIQYAENSAPWQSGLSPNVTSPPYCASAVVGQGSWWLTHVFAGGWDWFGLCQHSPVHCTAY
jgi:hypothetical protein